uniref:hypothetical protein n=1 Tax=Prevotella sp. TaxID=59823 RepID=UPI0025CEAB7F
MKKKQLHKSNWLVTMLLLVMAILMPYGGAWAQTASQPSEGNGSEGSPYIITKAEELAWFRDAVNDGNYEICAKIADNVEVIDLKDFCHAADASQNLKELSWEPIGNSDWSYVGTFDGNGKTITNLYINATQAYMGLFGRIYKSTIKNLTFENANVTNTENDIGILAGYAGNGNTLQNIKISNTCQIKGGNDFTGGIAGYLDGNAYNCVNYATVQGTEDVGGLVGYFESGTIKDCANYGDITGTSNVGNLIGNAYTCNLNNVLGTGNVTATNTKPGGILVGIIENSSGSTASGILAYSSSAKLTINGTEQAGDAVKAIGDGSLAYPEGKNEADVIKAFNPEQLNSGEVAWLLNGSTSVPTEGSTLAWYQKLLGADADAYPVLVAAEGNTVYNGSFRYCDGTTSSYSNSSSDSELIHVASATLTSPEFDSANHIYHMGCLNENCPEHKYAADAEGTLKATKAEDGKFYVEKLALTDASTAINTQAQFTIKDLQYSRQLNEGQKGYVTLCLPFDINAADVAGAEKCYPVGDMMIHMPSADASVLKFVLMLDEQSVIKAGTPMIVKLAAENASQNLVATAQNVEYSANFFANPTAKSLTLRDWDGKSGFMTICHELTNASIGGVYTTTPMAEGSYSFRADGKFGIHTGDLSPYRIYLNVQPSQSASSRTMLFSIGLPDDSSTTGIRIISLGDGKQTGSSAIYTLEGQRVMGTPRKGIYIKNGKKFSVK